jgi:hypothetical protein
MKKKGIWNRLPWGERDDIGMSDEVFDRLFEDIQLEPPPAAAERSPAEQDELNLAAFEEVWMALMAMGEYLQGTAETIRESNRQIQRLIGDLKEQYGGASRGARSSEQ